MYSYLVPYKVQNTLAEGLNLPTYPVYITLGLFLMMLNHMCVLYNQQDQEKVKKPLIYIDFNNKTNFCLANELVMSTNPLAFLVPFEGNRDSYKKLFEDIADEGENVYSITADGVTTPLFNPEDIDNDNILSGLLSPKYRYSQLDGAVTKASAYRGNIMNILVNIDYLLNTVDSFIKEDDESSVYLKPLLEKIVTDINKAMGNINVFRVAFNDYADTYYIVDDQVVAPTEKEDKITSSNANDKQLPLFGKNSIANSLEIKTDISTRLSNMIAISANAKIDQKYAASKDASAVGYLNTGFQDRYKKRILDQVPSTGSFNEVTKKSAIQFNETIKNFYSSDTAPLDKIAQATQYFMERMNKIKAIEPPTRAAAMIPVSVNFSTDGVSGMAMGQSFTVQDELLPYSYTTRKMPYGIPNYQKKVGFVIIGLDHEISNNRWTTSVRSNMYFIKDADMYSEMKLTNYNSNSNTSRLASFTNDTPNTADGCKRRRGELDEQIVASTIVKDAYGNYIKGKTSFIQAIESAYTELKAQNITLKIGDSLRSFDDQKNAYDSYLVAVANQKKGLPWVKNGITYPASKVPPNIANPCDGYHVIGQAIDLEQTESQKNDINSQGPIYQALFKRGLKRIPNEWWHWSIGEV